MKSLLAFLEPEEFVGKLWHGLGGKASTLPCYPEAALGLEEVRRPLTILFRGLGGSPGLRFAAAGETEASHRPSLRERVMGVRRVTVARRDGEAIYLPTRSDAWPEREVNRSLYVWLTAFFAHMPTRPSAPSSVARDIAFLREVRAATVETLAAAPGLRSLHAELCKRALRVRLSRKAPPAEAATEFAIRALLGETKSVSFDAACKQALACKPAAYHPFSPVPLWGEAASAGPGLPAVVTEDSGESAASEGDTRSRKARRSEQEQTERRDYLALNRFEKILAMAESMNLARPVDDDDEESARKAAEEAGEIVLSAHHKRAATRLRLELELSPAGLAEGGAAEGLRYPEWDWRRRAYRENYCRVIARPAPAGDASWFPSPETLRRIRRVRRQFEALRPRNETLRGQMDGDELDLEALVRARADLLAGGTPSERIYLTTRKQSRDLAVALLVDTSLSTESWAGTQRVIDIAREAALLFCHALDAGGDEHAVFAFTSRGRQDVRLDVAKAFSEEMSSEVTSRLGALRPGHYTRIGAAIRHASAELAKRPARDKLLLVLTDGKPNDIDHYEGRFGIEDTRRAIQETRRGGALVFGITIDAKAQAHFPVLFGRGGFAAISDPARLPEAMPLLLRHILKG